MNILITGGLGNVGLEVTELALARNNNVTILVHSNSSKNKKRMKPYKGKVDFIFGSVADKSFMHSIMKNIDCVIHLAALLPPKSEESYERTYKVNVNGTRNIIDAINFYDNKACLIYASSTSVFGPTQHKAPPLSVEDETNPINNYTSSKVETEALLSESDVKYSILRIASVMSDINGYDLSMIKLIYEFPPEGRNEIVLVKDVATAIMNCAELFFTDEDKVLGKTFLIGGGKENGCQITNGDMINGMFESLGIAPPSRECFIDNMDSYFMDWYDTEESQKILQFQNSSFDDYKKILKEQQRNRRIPHFLSSFLKVGLERMSPYKIKKNKEEK